MPPFGDEPPEKKHRPLSFLNLGHAPSKQRAPPKHRLFGDQPAELPVGSDLVCGVGHGQRAGTKFVPKRAFGDEDDENSKKLTCSKSGSSHRPLFGDEGSEDDDAGPPKPQRVFNAFADEASEGETSSQSNGEEKFLVKQDTAFTFGWGSVATFKKATAWRENMDDPKASKQKRNYDNSKRAKEAQYSRKQTIGHYKRNGVDPKRLQKLFSTQSCLCAFVWFLVHVWVLNNLLSGRPHQQYFLWLVDSHVRC